MLWDRVCGLFMDPSTLENFQLEAIEPLLCAAFESKHRHIVNTVLLMWNQVFDQTSSIEYPERLKAILLSIQPHVDINLPGLDVSGVESDNHRPPFLDSQDEFDVPSSFEAAYQNTPQPEPPSSSARSTPTGSVQLSLPKRRSSKRTPKSSKGGSTPRLGHDDSQVHFAAVESSPLARTAESQVLTDRQREVRERQRETASLFPEIRSSPDKAKSTHQLPATVAERSEVDGLQQVKVATPEAKHRYEGYGSSTPTPRRGQASIIDDDHEMTDDVPSSPPDPRRNLLPEMKPRSRSGSIPDNFPLSSSPVTGSPISKPWRLARHHASQDQPIPNNGGQEGLMDQREQVTDDIKDAEPAPVSGISDKLDEPMAQEDTQNQNANVGGSRTERLTPVPTSSLLEEAQKTPRSDDEDFVDAPTTPVTRASRKRRSTNPKMSAKAKKRGHGEEPDQSFELSDGEERSMTRLVIELDSRKCDPLPSYDAGSPEKSCKKQEKTTASCITVMGDEDSTPSRSQSRRTRSSGPASPIIQSDVERTPSSSKKSKKKRKRSSEAGEDPVSSGKKRKQHGNVEDEAAGPVLDSPVPLSFEQTPSQPAPSSEADHDEIMENSEMPVPSDIPPPSSSQMPADETGGASPGSPDSLDAERESEAVDLQLWTEASQEAESLRNSQLPHGTAPVLVPVKAEEQDQQQQEDLDAEMEDGAPTELEIEMPQAVASSASAAAAAEEAAAQEPSAVERIMGALRGGLEGLRAAALSRDDVYRIEDMFMDIKRELYNAESRGRGQGRDRRT